MLYHLVGFVVLLILVVTACSGFHPSSLHRYQNTFPPRKGLLFHSTPTSTNEVVAEMDSTNGMFSCSNRSLYPPAIRQKNGTLEVDSIHTLYYEEYGKHNNTNEKGKKRRTGIPNMPNFSIQTSTSASSSLTSVVVEDPLLAGK